MINCTGIANAFFNETMLIIQIDTTLTSNAVTWLDIAIYDNATFTPKTIYALYNAITNMSNGSSAIIQAFRDGNTCKLRVAGNNCVSGNLLRGSYVALLG